MPKLNSKGEWCAGIGGSTVSYQGQVIATPAAGSASWIDDTHIIYQQCDGDVCRLYIYDTTTGQIAIAANRGANSIAAGGKVWAAWLAGYGLYASTGLYLPDAGLITVGRSDGAIGYKKVYQSDGPYYAKETDGSEWLITQTLGQLQLLGNQEACWTADSTIHTTEGVPTPIIENWNYGMRMVLVNNTQWWVLYASSATGCYVAHPAENPGGPIAIHPELSEQQFGFDAVAVGSIIHYVFATNEGESPESVVKGTIDTGVPGGGGGVSDGGGPAGAGGATSTLAKLRAWNTFPVIDATTAVADVTFYSLPEFPVQQGRGRLVHPLFGPFDYHAKPDEWVNIDTDIVIPPVWSSVRSLGGSVNALWPGYVRDVVVEERWKSLGGLAMPIGQLRWMIMMWVNPVDPDTGYVQWYPNYVSPLGYRVLLLNLAVGGQQGIALDDVINYLDANGPDGWVTAPVTLTMKIVERLEI